MDLFLPLPLPRASSPSFLPQGAKTPVQSTPLTRIAYCTPYVSGRTGLTYPRKTIKIHPIKKEKKIV